MGVSLLQGHKKMAFSPLFWENKVPQYPDSPVRGRWQRDSYRSPGSDLDIWGRLFLPGRWGRQDGLRRNQTDTAEIDFLGSLGSTGAEV